MVADVETAAGFPVADESGRFEPTVGELIWSPDLDRFDFPACIQVIEQADGWRAGVTAHLPEGESLDAFVSVSHRPTESRSAAILDACDVLLMWLGEKVSGGERQRRAHTDLRTWAIGLKSTVATGSVVSWTDRLRAIQDLDEGRALLAEHRVAVHALQVELGITPTCVDGRDFGSVKAREWKAAVREAKAIDAARGAQLEALVADGVAMYAAWSEVYGQFQARSSRPAPLESAPAPVVDGHVEIPSEVQPQSLRDGNQGDGAGISVMEQPNVQMIPIEEVIESEWNPRKVYPEGPMAELTESMRASGFRPWQALVVRPAPDHVWRMPGLERAFELAAGHRRRRAAYAAGIRLVPCIVQPMTDEEFRDVLNFDNSGREDVHPLHEAAGWHDLLNNGKSVQYIAARIGKSIEYVYQRLKYKDLIEEGQQAFIDDKISARHAVIIARRPPAVQKKALKYCLDQARSVRELERFIAWDLDLKMSTACFDLESVELVPAAGSCAACPKRTTNAPDLRVGGPEVGSEDVCTDPGCFQSKVAAHLVQVKAAVSKKSAEVIDVSSNWGKAKKGVLGRDKYDVVKAGEPGAKVAVVVDGHDVGKVVHIKMRAEGPSRAEEDAEREAAAQKEKDDREMLVRDRILDAVRAKVRGLTRADVEMLLAEYLHRNEDADILCKWRGRKCQEYDGDRVLIAALPQMKEWEIALLVIEMAVVQEFSEWAAQREPSALLALAKRYKVDAAKIRAEVEGGTRREVKQPVKSAAKKAPVKKKASAVAALKRAAKKGKR